MIALGYKDRAEVVAKIDQLVIERRRANPAVTFSRAAFLREAVNRALAEAMPPPVRVRTHRRKSLIAVKSAAPTA